MLDQFVLSQVKYHTHTHTHSIMRMQPTDALLEICPFSSIPGSFGCLSRREVQERGVDASSRSIVRIAPAGAESVQETNAKAGAWLRNVLGDTDFAEELGANHSNIMNRRFQLNARFRNAFMISPSMPWRQAELDNARIASILEMAQFSITAILISIDTKLPLSPDPAATSRRRNLLSFTGTNARAATSHPLLAFDSPLNADKASVALSPSSRKMLAADSSQASLVSKTSKAKNESMTQATMCEITSINNYDNVAKVACDKTNSTFAHCELLKLKKMVPVGIFCLTEREFVLRMQDEIRQDIVLSSRNTIAHMQITSVLKPGFETICKASASRRLLQNQHVTITFAVGTQEPYHMALDELNRMGYGNVSVLTRATSMLQMCDSTVPGSCMLVPAFLAHGIGSKTLYESESSGNSTTQGDVAITIILAIIGAVCIVCAGCFCVYYYMLRNPKTIDYIPPVSHAPLHNSNYYAIHSNMPGRFDHVTSL